MYLSRRELVFSFSINVELCLFNYLLFRVTHACSIFMYTYFSRVHVFFSARSRFAVICLISETNSQFRFSAVYFFFRFFRKSYCNLHTGIVLSTQQTPNLPIFSLFRFGSAVFFRCAVVLRQQIKMWKRKQKKSVPRGRIVRKCKLIKGHNSYWHKSLHFGGGMQGGGDDGGELFRSPHGRAQKTSATR